VVSNSLKKQPPHRPTKNFTPTANVLVDYWWDIIGTDAAALYVILDRLHDEEKGFAYPSREWLEKKMKRTGRSIRKARKALEDNNLLEVKTGGRGNNNRYFLKSLPIPDIIGGQNNTSLNIIGGQNNTPLGGQNNTTTNTYITKRDLFPKQQQDLSISNSKNNFDDVVVVSEDFSISFLKEEEEEFWSEMDVEAVSDITRSIVGLNIERGFSVDNTEVANAIIKWNPEEGFLFARGKAFDMMQLSKRDPSLVRTPLAWLKIAVKEDWSSST